MERLKAFWKDSPDGFCLFDHSLLCLDINRSALRATGRKKTTSVGRSLSTLFPAFGDDVLGKIRAILKTGKASVFLDVPALISRGRFARVAAFKVRGGLGMILSDMTKTHGKEAELRYSLAQVKTLTQHDLLFKERECRRIARKIHDEMAPLLTTFKMDLYWVLRRLENDGIPIQAVNDKIVEMERLVDNTITSVREICSELRPALLDELGLPAALEWQIQEFQKKSTLQCRASILANGVSLDPDLSLCLFRIFLEGFGNILRHAEASKAEVVFRHLRSRKILQMKIRDNGRGIRPEEAADPKAYGLIGIRERLSPYDGRLKIDGVPGQGTTLTVTIPFASGSN